MIYVMSDIHGCLNRYRNVLRQIRLRKDDHLYILGDVIDRGPEGLRILKDTMERGNVTLLLGNHEHMMLEALSHPDNDDVGLSIILDTIGRKNFFRRKPLQRTHRPVVGTTLVGS